MPVKGRMTVTKLLLTILSSCMTFFTFKPKTTKKTAKQAHLNPTVLYQHAIIHMVLQSNVPGMVNITLINDYSFFEAVIQSIWRVWNRLLN